MVQGSVKNGVADLRLLPANEVLEMEPSINPGVVAALWAPQAE